MLSKNELIKTKTDHKIILKNKFDFELIKEDILQIRSEEY